MANPSAPDLTDADRTFLRQVNNLLIIKLGSLGDVLQADGAFRDIRVAFPNAQVTVLTMPAYRKLLDRSPFIDRVMTDPRKPRWRLDAMLQLRSKLRAEDFDLVIDLQTQRRTNSYFRWFLSDTAWSGTAPGCRFPDRQADRKSIPSLDRIAGQLEQMGVEATQTRSPNVDWMIEPVGHVISEAGLTKPLIVLIPGCSARHPQKRWPHYADLASRLLEGGYSVATAPGPDEMELCHAIPGATLTGGRFLDYFQLAGLFSRADFIIGNDTGPTHLAANMNRPGLAIFGWEGGAVRTGLDRPSFTAIEKNPISSITVDEVLQAVPV